MCASEKHTGLAAGATVSVVIPTFNRMGWIAEAAGSVLDQTHRDLELIVVDDGSTDDSVRRLEAATIDARARFVYQENRGVSAARNRGIAEARGQWIAFLDSDDVWKPEKLARQMEWHRRHPHYRISCTDEEWIRRGRRVNPRTLHQKYCGWILLESMERCIVSPSSALVDRKVFEEAGLFDEALPVCEDYDLWLRVGLRYPIGYVPETLIVKRGGHAGQLSARRAADVFRVRALENLLSENLPDLVRERVRTEIVKRAMILAAGFEKRDGEQAKAYRTLAARVRPPK